VSVAAQLTARYAPVSAAAVAEIRTAKAFLRARPVAPLAAPVGAAAEDGAKGTTAAGTKTKTKAKAKAASVGAKVKQEPRDNAAAAAAAGVAAEPGAAAEPEAPPLRKRMRRSSKEGPASSAGPHKVD